jgi:hypothetical protein
MSANSVDVESHTTNGASDGTGNGLKIKISGAAALKPTEIAMEQVAGKKKSKFWVYAVEPIPGTTQPPPGATEGSTNDATNGHRRHSNDSNSQHPPSLHGNGNDMDYDRSLEGSLSPLPSV